MKSMNLLKWIYTNSLLMDEWYKNEVYFRKVERGFIKTQSSET